jgi:hypothetical protein
MLEICYFSCHGCWSKGRRNNKGEKQLLIANGEGEFDQNVFVFGIISKQNMNNFLKHIMEGNVLWS